MRIICLKEVGPKVIFDKAEMNQLSSFSHPWNKLNKHAYRD